MRHRKAWFGLILVALVVSSASACSNQGEGQRCDKNSADSDCASGLVCVPYRSNSPSGTGGSGAGELGQYVCCPQNGSATTVACANTGTTFDAGPTTSGTGGEDGGTDSGAGTGGAGTGGEGTGGAGTGGEGTGGTANLDAGTPDAP
jgi:hypothetical protein